MRSYKVGKRNSRVSMSVTIVSELHLPSLWFAIPPTIGGLSLFLSLKSKPPASAVDRRHCCNRVVNGWQKEQHACASARDFPRLVPPTFHKYLRDFIHSRHVVQVRPCEYTRFSLAVRRMQQTHATGSIVRHEFRARNRGLDLFPVYLLRVIGTAVRRTLIVKSSVRQKKS